MENTSPFLAIQRVERQLKNMLRSATLDSLDPEERKAIQGLRQLVIDTRLDIRDYELSETRAEQLKCAVAARAQLQTLQEVILKAGTVFGPADVAHLGAQFQQIHSRIV